MRPVRGGQVGTVLLPSPQSHPLPSHERARPPAARWPGLDIPHIAAPGEGWAQQGHQPPPTFPYSVSGSSRDLAQGSKQMETDARKVQRQSPVSLIRLGLPS